VVLTPVMRYPRLPAGAILRGDVGKAGTAAEFAYLSPERVGFQKSATYAERRLYAACSYLLIRPPRTGRRLIRP
jgi:hypothetical protein